MHGRAHPSRAGVAVAAYASPASEGTVERADPASTLVSTIAAYVELMKLRLVALLVLVAVASAIAAAGGLPGLTQLLQLVLAGGLASAGAGALNHVIERDLDARMTRTRARPLPSGRVSARGAAAFGIGLVVLGLIPALALGPVTTAIIMLGAGIYVGAYTLWLKPTSPWSVVIGGLSGTCATLAGWSIGDSVLTPAAFWSGLTLFLWSPPHFWCLALARRDEYGAAGFPTLANVATPERTLTLVRWGFITTVASALALGVAVGGGLIYLLPTALLGGYLLYRAYRLTVTSTARECIAVFGISMSFMAVSYVALALNALVR